MRPFIVIGDRTDHGGVVIGATMATDTHGKRLARVGDQVTCPKKGHGTTVIVSGDPTMIVDGAPVARHGDKCACGATLISSQVLSRVTGGSDNQSMLQTAARASAPGVGKAAGLITSLLPENHNFDIHFIVQDERTGAPLAQVPYKITLEDGSSITGVTNESGLTEKISSNTRQKATLETHHHGDDDCGADTQKRYDACCC